MGEGIIKDNKVWVCNECGFSDYTDTLTEDEIENWLQCSNCGCPEFHLEIDKTTINSK